MPEISDAEREGLDFDVEQDEPGEHHVHRDRLSTAVLYTADWTVETAISQMRQGNIFLQPNFQRRDAWRVPHKSKFIESILLGLPIPQIVLAERMDERGEFIVLDGKQRLLTLLQFVGGAQGSPANAFRLTGLEVLEELKGVTFKDLPTPLRRQFLNYAIRSSIIRNWPDSAFLEIVFVRLNQGSVKLSPQELRQGIAPGPFTSFIEEASAASDELQRLLRIREPDFRMRDAELLLRLIAFQLYGDDYNGNMKEFLDEVTIDLNNDWQSISSRVQKVTAEINKAIAYGFEVFSEEHFGRKWNGERYESAPNRAVIDIQVAYFAKPKIRRALKGKEQDIEVAFQRMSSKPKFVRSVEVTTKSVQSVKTRFEMWGQVIANIAGFGHVNPFSD